MGMDGSEMPSSQTDDKASHPKDETVVKKDADSKEAIKETSGKDTSATEAITDDIEAGASGISKEPSGTSQVGLSGTSQESLGTSLESASPSSKADEEVAKWGKPLGLPSPVNPGPGGSSRSLNNDTNNKQKTARKAEKKITPVYMDLAYVPHHGDANYTDIEFFKRVRARYYVFSGVEPSRAVFDALLEAKKMWENKDLEVTIIPTYDSDVLGYWVADNEDALTEHKIDLAPSASRCTINLQDHETSCAAYRLEF